MLGIRFVSHGPHDDAGMIFVLRDQIPQDLLVQGVERLGAVHGQYSDGSALFKGYKRHSENSSLYLVHGGAVRPLLSLIIQQNIRAGKGNRSQSHRQPSGGIG